MTTPKEPAVKKTARKVTPKLPETSEWKKHYGNAMAEGFGLATVFVIVAGAISGGKAIINKFSGNKAEAED